MRIKQTSLLSHGQFVSIFGDTFFDVALSYWILELTESTTAVASIGLFRLSRIWTKYDSLLEERMKIVLFVAEIISHSLFLSYI